VLIGRPRPQKRDHPANRRLGDMIRDAFDDDV